MRRNSKLTQVALPLTVMATLFVAMLLPTTVEAGSKLWLYPDSENPQNGGHVVETGNFVLNIENLGSGNGDTTAYEVFVVLSVNDPAFLAGGSLGLPDGTSVTLDPGAFVVNTPVFPCSGHSFPPHGAFPSFLAEFFVGDFANGQVRQFAVDMQGDEGLVAHFDAFGTGYIQAGPNLKCYDVSNPAGHDVSVVFGEGGDEEPCSHLTIDKVASVSGVDLGDEVVFTISVENDSECDATEVVVSEDIPMLFGADGIELPAFSIVAVNPSPTQQTDSMLIWEIGDLPAGESVVFTVTVVFDEPAADGSFVENTACVVFVESDEMICDRAEVAVGSVGCEIGGPGFWCNQIRFALEGRHNAKFTLEELEEWLRLVNESSTVFPELWDTTTLEGAGALLCRPSEAETVADRLVRHLLALQFNIAGERVDPELSLGDLCEGSMPLPEDADPTMTIAELVPATEADILAGADNQILGSWHEAIDFVNNALVSGCSEVRVFTKMVS